MVLLTAVHSEAGTFHSLAAACTSMMRAVAPPLRTYSWLVRMPRLPPVEKSPQARLRATLWPGVGNSVVTLDQSHSSSSATSWAKPVSVPCPISERAMRITQVSSGLIATQTFTSVARALFCACASPSPNGTWKPSANPPPAAAAEPTMNLRRERLRPLSNVIFFMAPSLRPAFGAIGRLAAGGGRGAGRGVHGLADALVGAAATDVGHRIVDVLV